MILVLFGPPSERDSRLTPTGVPETSTRVDEEASERVNTHPTPPLSALGGSFTRSVSGTLVGGEDVKEVWGVGWVVV